MALLHSSKVSAVEYPEKDGHCPYKAGDLSSNVKHTLNPHRLTGHWINLFDRASLNEEKRCYAVKLQHTLPYDEATQDIANEEHMKDVPKLFEYLKATNVGTSGDIGDYEDYDDPGSFDNDDMIAFGYHVYNGF